MAKRRPLFPRILSAAIFIFLEIAALSILRSGSQARNLWLARAGHGFMGTVWGATEGVKNFFALRKTNEKLAEENFRLRTVIERGTFQQHQAYIDTLSGLPRIGHFEYLNAEVVKASRNKQHNYIIVSKGYEDGVKEKSGIVTTEGVVGIVDAVSAHYSFALSLLNADISISARLGTEGAVGPLAWDGKSRRGAILREIPLQYKFEPGDTVFTSGYSSIFPPDIPLGTAGESRIINGATMEIKVSLFQDFGSLRYVTLVHNTDFDELEGFGI